MKLKQAKNIPVKSVAYSSVSGWWGILAFCTSTAFSRTSRMPPMSPAPIVSSTAFTYKVGTVTPVSHRPTSTFESSHLSSTETNWRRLYRIIPPSSGLYSLAKLFISKARIMWLSLLRECVILNLLPLFCCFCWQGHHTRKLLTVHSRNLLILKHVIDVGRALAVRQNTSPERPLIGGN